MSLDRFRFQQQILARRYELELHNKVLRVISKNDDQIHSQMSNPPLPSASEDCNLPSVESRDQK